MKILVEFMEENHVLAKNSLVEDVNEKRKKEQLWDKLTEVLNSNGPPIKSKKLWKKVWADFKYNTKKKLAKNRKSRTKTGGGPPEEIYISPLEEATVVAAGLEASISGIRNSKSFGVASSSRAVNGDNEDEIQESILELIGSPDNSREADQPREAEQQIGTETSTGISMGSATSRASKKDYTELINKDISEKEHFHREVLKILKEKNSIEKRKLEVMEKHYMDVIDYKNKKLDILKGSHKDATEYRNKKNLRI